MERVKAGLRNARAKRKHLGRPRVIVDARRIVLGSPSERSFPED